MKKAKITCCLDCPNFDYEYYDYDGECMLLQRIILTEVDHMKEIHKYCPLDDWEDVNDTLLDPFETKDVF